MKHPGCGHKLIVQGSMAPLRFEWLDVRQSAGMPNVENHKLWKPGEQILLQELWQGQLFISRPETVVEDRPDLLVLYSHPNAPFRSASRMHRGLSLEEGVTILMSSEAPQFAEKVSRNMHVLSLTPPDMGHSVRLYWTTDWQLEFWYVNLQTPILRSARGILVEDQVLDIVVKPGMSWSWKDEEMFSELQQRSFYTRDEALSIRAEGERVAQLIERNAPPFCDGWERWRPDPGWPLPGIPIDWQVLDEHSAL